MGNLNPYYNESFVFIVEQEQLRVMYSCMHDFTKYTMIFPFCLNKVLPRRITDPESFTDFPWPDDTTWYYLTLISDTCSESVWSWWWRTMTGSAAPTPSGGWRWATTGRDWSWSTGRRWSRIRGGRSSTGTFWRWVKSGIGNSFSFNENFLVTVLASRERSLNILLIHSTTKVGIVWKRTLTFNLIKIFWKTLILFVFSVGIIWIFFLREWFI